MHIVKKLNKEDIYGLVRVDSERSATLPDLKTCNEKTEDSLQKAIELNPKNDKAYTRLGRFYRVQGKLPQAEDSFKKAIELSPKNDSAYIRLGWLYQLQGKLPQAEDSFKKAIELNPKNVKAYIGLGWLYQAQGKLSQAEDSFKKAIELNPKNDGAYGAISVLCEEIGKPELAKEYAKKANRLRLEPNNPATVNNYRKIKEILDKRGIRLVCVQYPMRSIGPLKKIFEGDKGVIFVDNEAIFKEMVKKSGFKEVFQDMFGGDFGHCTPKGNRLLAENIANVILKEVFHK